MEKILDYLLNIPTEIWPYGYGGAGANDPEYGWMFLLKLEKST